MEPFQIQEWWLVVRLERYLPASFDAAMNNKMCTEMFEQWIQEQTTRKIAAYTTPDPAATPV